MMDRKITIQQFAALVAETASMPQPEVLDIIKTIFRSVASRLHEGEPVELPGIGRFTLTKAGDERVMFTPDGALAESINSPFQSFTAVELSADYEDPEEEEIAAEVPEETVEESVEESAEEPVEEPVEEVVEQPAEEYVEEPAEEPAEEPVEEVVEEAVVMPEIPVEEPVSEEPPTHEIPAIPEIPPTQPVVPPPFDPAKAYASVPVIEEDTEEYVTAPAEEPAESKSKFTYGLICGVVIAAAIAALGYFVYQVFLV